MLGEKASNLETGQISRGDREQKTKVERASGV